MNINLTALSVKFLYGRNVVTCVPRDAETNKQLGPENSLTQVITDLKAGGHTIENATEVLECVVVKFGFGA